MSEQLYKIKCIPIILVLSFFFSCEPDGTNPKKYHFPDAVEENINDDQLKRAFDSADDIADIQGLAVSRNFKVVAEKYYTDSTSGPDQNLHVMSVTKSYMSTLIGIAIDKGFIQSVDQNLSFFLGEEVDAVNPALGQVTLHQLLTMSCGHLWKEIDEPSEFYNFATAPDQLNYILAKPVVNTPGTVFDYSDGAAHLVSAILSKAAGMNASAFAQQYLFGPMGIGDRFWYEDNRAVNYGGTGVCVGIQDMIELGHLYLNDGLYNGQRIVSADWINTATTTQISTNNILPYIPNYGYYWWIGSRHGHDYILAHGWGGQFILVVKDLNLVVAARCNWRSISTAQAGQNWQNIQEIIFNQILPAVNE